MLDCCKYMYVPVDRYVHAWSFVCSADAFIYNNHGVNEICYGNFLTRTTQTQGVGIHYPSGWVCILDSTDVSQSTNSRITLQNKEGK